MTTVHFSNFEKNKNNNKKQTQKIVDKKAKE
jgi:hypothetical protein